MANFEQLNRQTWQHNNIGNHHHHSKTGIKHPTNYNRLNNETFSNNNKISVHEMYERMGRQW